MAIRKYTKGSTQYVQPSFQVDEFDCRCKDPSCIWTWIDDDLVLGLEMMRDRLLLPIHISEGFRCAARQEYMRNAKNPDGTPMYETAVGTSAHETGQAADIKTGKHTGLELEAVARKVGFKAVGVGERWVHIDTRDILNPNGKTRSWKYSY